MTGIPVMVAGLEGMAMQAMVAVLSVQDGCDFGVERHMSVHMTADNAYAYAEKEIIPQLNKAHPEFMPGSNRNRWDIVVRMHNFYA